MNAVKSGQLDAMAPLFERYSGPVLGFFVNLTSDRETSRDLTQMVFERLLRYRHTFVPNSQFRPWIYRVARNVLADHRRRMARMRTVPLATESDDGGAGFSWLDEVNGMKWRAAQKARDLQDALDQLPSDDREVLVLHRFHGLPYAEIADIVEKSGTAVKTQAHRALEALRRVYFDERAIHES